MSQKRNNKETQLPQLPFAYSFSVKKEHFDSVRLYIDTCSDGLATSYIARSDAHFNRVLLKVCIDTETPAVAMQIAYNIGKYVGVLMAANM